MRVPVVATFRGAVVLLAALELLAFGWVALSRGTTIRDAIAMAMKVLVLGGAYVALSA